MKKISIIVPVYKVEKYLDKCVESIVKQTYKNIEIILVDDGSPDNCPKMCDEWAKKDNRIKVIHKENGGLSDARNKGIEIATGDYIGFVDSDDVISEKMFEKLLSLSENNNADIGICSFARFIEGSLPNYTYSDDDVVIDKDEAIKKVLLEKIGNHVCNKLFKRELFNNVSFTRGVAYEDIFIFYKLILNSNKVAITKSRLYGYMQRADSITNNCTLKNVRDFIRANNTRYDYLKNNKELEEYLKISMMKYGYIIHVKAASTRDKNFYFSNELLKEYNKFKNNIKFKYLKSYLECGNIKTKLYQLILIYNRKLFWKFMTRKKLNNKLEIMNKETSEKKVSIIAIAYKVEKYLDKCIESLVNQTYKNLEIILVDDGSPDNCPQICDEWAKRDSRIKVIHKENGGVSDARNKGLEIATGDYIAYVDADDVVSKDMYKVLVDTLEKNDADVSACQEAKFEDGKEPKFSIEDKEYILNGSNEILRSLIKKSLIKNFVWNKLYKKELLNGIEFPYGKSCQDIYTMHTILSRAKRCAITTSKLYGYLQRSESVVHSYSKEYIATHIDAVLSQYNDLKDNKELIKDLNVSRAKNAYLHHTQAALSRNPEIYNSEMLLNEYKFLKKTINIENFWEYLISNHLKISILKIILLIDRKLFYKIKTR